MPTSPRSASPFAPLFSSGAGADRMVLWWRALHRVGVGVWVAVVPKYIRFVFLFFTVSRGGMNNSAKLRVWVCASWFVVPPGGRAGGRRHANTIWVWFRGHDTSCGGMCAFFFMWVAWQGSWWLFSFSERLFSVGKIRGGGFACLRYKSPVDKFIYFIFYAWDRHAYIHARIYLLCFSVACLLGKCCLIVDCWLAGAPHPVPESERYFFGLSCDGERRLVY